MYIKRYYQKPIANPDSVMNYGYVVPPLVFMGGSDDGAPSTPQLSAPPPTIPLKDVYNYIAGVKTEKFTLPDGKEGVRTVQLPRSPEEEQFWGWIQNSLRYGVTKTKQLIDINPAKVADFMPFINTLSRVDEETKSDLAQIAGLDDIEGDLQHIRDVSREYLDTNFNRQREALENSLAHRGLSNSLQADKERTELSQRFDKAVRDNDFEVIRQGDELASKRFGRRMEGFQARQFGRQVATDAAKETYNAQRITDQDTEAGRAARIGEQGIIANQANQLINQDKQMALGANTHGAMLSQNSLENNNQMNHYNADINRQTQQYNMNLAQWNANNSAPTFLSSALNIGTTLGGAALGGYMANPNAGYLAKSTKSVSTPFGKLDG